MPATIYLGCAGWTLRKEHFTKFPEIGSHLQRYSTRFNCVEINSSFYRPHKESTYQRWADCTPDDFRFAVKLPKQITHINRLKSSREAITQFQFEVNGLGSKLGAVLVQLPPSLEFESVAASNFFDQITQTLACPVLVEPRHASWFNEDVYSFLVVRNIGRVAADPAVTPAAAIPISGKRLTYYRWHGSPRVYYSSYDDSTLMDQAQRLVSAALESNTAWCIFDNTAAGAATANALWLKDHLSGFKTCSWGL